MEIYIGKSHGYIGRYGFEVYVRGVLIQLTTYDLRHRYTWKLGRDWEGTYCIGPITIGRI